MVDTLDKTIDQNGEGINFDPSVFMNSIFSSIDDNRSTMSSAPFEIVETPSNRGTGKPAEPRLNTFLRLIGMPAVRDERFLLPENQPQNSDLLDFIKDKGARSNALSQNSTLNYFTAGSADLTGGILVRNQILDSTSKPNITDFNQMLQDPLALDASISDTLNYRRAPLFPLVTDASVPVFPVEHRVAPLFNDGAYIFLGGQPPARRPFLQHVIYIRTKIFSGDTSSLEASLRKNILAEVGPDSTLDAALGNFNLLELRVIQRFIEAFKNIARNYHKTINSLKIIRAQISYTAVPVGNPHERSGSQAQITPDTLSTSVPSLDNQIQGLDQLINFEDLFLLTLPTEDVNRSDIIRNIEDQTVINNVSTDIFIPEFMSLLTYNRDVLNKKKQRLEQDRAILVQRFERARRDLTYYTGEFTGLSIVDVLGVLYGLFTVDVSVLMALLNDGARFRLLSDPFYSSASGVVELARLIPGELLPLTVALTSLNKQVKEGFSIATNFYKQITSSNVINSPISQVKN